MNQNNSNVSTALLIIIIALLIIIIAILLIGVGPFLKIVGYTLLFVSLGGTAIFISILIYLPFGILIEIIKERKRSKNSLKWHGVGKRWDRYVMHVEEVANRFCRTHPKKDKDKIMEIVRKRWPFTYITKQGVHYF